MTIQLDPTTCKPGDVFRIRVGDRVFVGERVDPEDYLQWRLNRPTSCPSSSVWVRDVDVTVLHRLVPEAEEETLDAPMQPWETLRRLADDHQQFCSEYLRMPYEAAETVRTVSPGDIRKEADRLEADHRAAQEKAAADAKMDALIDESIDAYNRAAEAQASRAPLGSRDTAPWRDGIRAVIDVVLAEAGDAP